MSRPGKSAYAGFALVLVAAFGAAFGAAAQTAPRSAQPGARLDPLSAPPPGPAPRVTVFQPTGERPSGVPGQGIELHLTLNAVKLTPEGARLASLPDLRRVADEAVGSVVGFPELEALRRRLTETLVAAGYVSSGARLREIDLDAGVAVYEIVEGRLTGVRVSGEGVAADDRALGELGADHVEARIAPPEGPFNINDIEESLRVLLRDRGVERVDAAISPGAAPGDARLDVDVSARRPYDLGFTIVNDTPDGLGETTARVNLAARNLVTSGDELRVEAELSEGRRRIILDGDAPLWPGGPAPYFTVEQSNSAFVKEPLSTLDVESEFSRAGFGLRIPVIETSRRRLATIVGLDWKRTESRLLGQRFSFSSGVRDGISKTAVLSLAQEFVDLGDDRTIAIRAAVNLGLPILGATQNGPGVPDGQFTSFIAQAQVAQLVTPELTLIGRAQGQIASGALLPLEQIAIGGRDTVRGFGEAVVAGDDALVGSLEARIRTVDLPVGGLTPPDHDAVLVLAPFVDAGAVWRKGRGGDTLASVGGGLLWSPRPGVDASLYYGAALTGRRGGGLQGRGVHFAISFVLP